MDIFESVNDAFDHYAENWDILPQHRVETRAGIVERLDFPQTIIYTNPRDRVLINPERDCNPFFHFMEGLWMICGRDDVASLVHFNARMKDFSDDNRTFNGAYGDRWRYFFGIDQIESLICLLRTDPTTRRAVLSMYSPHDLWSESRGAKSKDIPCNTHAYFQIRDERLYMTVCNRSNDLIWGLFGANAVHFSMLQEFLACALGLQMGTYIHFSNDVHVYETTRHLLVPNVSTRARVNPKRMFDKPEDWGRFRFQAEQIFRHLTNPAALTFGFVDSSYYLHSIALPMLLSWTSHKARRYDLAFKFAEQIGAPDWQLACIQWLQKRERLYERRDSPNYQVDEEGSRTAQGN